MQSQGSLVYRYLFLFLSSCAKLFISHKFILTPFAFIWLLSFWCDPIDNIWSRCEGWL
jgi:hypothetical protein